MDRGLWLKKGSCDLIWVLTVGHYGRLGFLSQFFMVDIGYTLTFVIAKQGEIFGPKLCQQFLLAIYFCLVFVMFWLWFAMVLTCRGSFTPKC